MVSERRHIPGAKARVFAGDGDVRAEARTYLRGKSNGEDRGNYATARTGNCNGKYRARATARAGAIAREEADSLRE
jgi:hypothetical protein